MTCLVKLVETKYAANYSAHLSMLHLKALANYFQMAAKQADVGLFEATLALVDTMLDNVAEGSESPETPTEVAAAVEVLLSPAMDAFVDALNPNVITVCRGCIIPSV